MTADSVIEYAWDRIAGKAFDVALDRAKAGSAAIAGFLSTSKVRKVNGRNPINSKDWAGKVHPSGVRFTDEGFPDFFPWAEAKVEITGLTGKYGVDEAMALAAAGLDETPVDMVWHHVEDGVTMILIPKSIHDAARHTGGAAVIRGGG